MLPPRPPLVLSDRESSALETALTSPLPVLGTLTFVIGIALFVMRSRALRSPRDDVDAPHLGWPITCCSAGLVLTASALLVHGVVG